MIYIPWFILAIAIAQMLEDWYLRHDIDYQEGGLAPVKVFAWGTCRSLSGRNDFRYVKIAVPFARQWMVRYDSSACWHQLVFFRFAGEWRSYWAPAQ